MIGVALGHGFGPGCFNCCSKRQGNSDAFWVHSLLGVSAMAYRNRDMFCAFEVYKLGQLTRSLIGASPDSAFCRAILHGPFFFSQWGFPRVFSHIFTTGIAVHNAVFVEEIKEQVEREWKRVSTTNFRKLYPGKPTLESQVLWLIATHSWLQISSFWSSMTCSNILHWARVFPLKCHEISQLTHLTMTDGKSLGII